jgi:hypothetical protein
MRETPSKHAFPAGFRALSAGLRKARCLRGQSVVSKSHAGLVLCIIIAIRPFRQSFIILTRRCLDSVCKRSWHCNLFENHPAILFQFRRKYAIMLCMANKPFDRPKSGLRIRPRYIILFFILTFFVLGGVYLSQQTKLKSIAEEKVESKPISTISRLRKNVLSACSNTCRPPTI